MRIVINHGYVLSKKEVIYKALDCFSIKNSAAPLVTDQWYARFARRPRFWNFVFHKTTNQRLVENKVFIPLAALGDKKKCNSFSFISPPRRVRGRNKREEKVKNEEESKRRAA